MEVNNLLDIHTREELYNWYLHNHDKVKEFWLRVNRAAKPFLFHPRRRMEQFLLLILQQ